MGSKGFSGLDKYPGSCSVARQALFRILHLLLEAHTAAVLLADSVLAVGFKYYQGRQM